RQLRLRPTHARVVLRGGRTAPLCPFGSVGRRRRMRPTGPLKEVGTSAASWRYARARPAAHSPQWGPRWGSLTLRPRRAPYPYAADWPPGGGRHLGRVVALCPCAAESAFAPVGVPPGRSFRTSAASWR